ncbi:unnamed protein product [Parascedosporium putredinis]|uniref:Uncharacterized protein n=1 Tax=Parascedosporium putredinis TaxID=1442378 RepID=A0A9P1GUK5_9PEZI|nr:unnamed protein product [Parascedosporium putredinis]CAI7987919.1 unnamed protein product [Parascedosporium putredinis]
MVPTAIDSEFGGRLLPFFLLLYVHLELGHLTDRLVSIRQTLEEVEEGEQDCGVLLLLRLTKARVEFIHSYESMIDS